MKCIKLTQGKVAIVDDADYEWLNQWRWYAQKRKSTWYAVRNRPRIKGKYIQIYMHREILQLEKGDPRQGDHRNHNGLDNRRDNIRICTAAENSHNQRPRNSGSSIFKGVSWEKNKKKWQVHIGINGHFTHLGLFHSETEAARTYDQKAKEVFGEFACVNFI